MGSKITEYYFQFKEDFIEKNIGKFKVEIRYGNFDIVFGEAKVE